MLTITASRSRTSSNRRTTWALSFSSVLRQEAQSRLELKPSPSAFADFLKHGSTYTARSVSASMGRRYGLPRKRRLQWPSARALHAGRRGVKQLTQNCINSSLGFDYCVVWVLAINLAPTKDRQVGLGRIDTYLPNRDIPRHL